MSQCMGGKPGEQEFRKYNTLRQSLWTTLRGKCYSLPRQSDGYRRVRFDCRFANPMASDDWTTTT